MQLLISKNCPLICVSMYVYACMPGTFVSFTLIQIHYWVWNYFNRKQLKLKIPRTGAPG